MVALDVLLLVVVLLVLVASALTVRRVYGAAKRGLGGAAERTGEVRARMQPPGPGRDAAVLRARLDTEVRATREMLRDAPQGLVFRADAASLLVDLEEAAASLTRELAAIGTFRDAAQQRAALRAIAPQAEELIETTYRARQTLLQTSVQDRAGDLSRLRARVDQQAAALEAYRRDGGPLSL